MTVLLMQDLETTEHWHCKRISGSTEWNLWSLLSAVAYIQYLLTFLSFSVLSHFCFLLLSLFIFYWWQCAMFDGCAIVTSWADSEKLCIYVENS